MKLIFKYQSGGQSSFTDEERNALFDFVGQRIYKESPNYQEGKFLGKNWNTRYDGKVNWNGGVYPSWLFVEPEWYKQMNKAHTLNPKDFEDSYKVLSNWFSSLFNNSEPSKNTKNKEPKEPKERPGIGKKGDI